jgi:L1 cell adhesion molecule like protein
MIQLSKDGIVCMKNNAVMYRAESWKQMQKSGTKNSLESYCFNMKSAVEHEKLNDKTSETKINTMLDKWNAFIRCLNAKQLA